jgi:hypothetical protein
MGDTFPLTVYRWIAKLVGTEDEELGGMEQNLETVLGPIRGSDYQVERDDGANDGTVLEIEMSIWKKRGGRTESTGAFFKYWLDEGFPGDLSVMQVYKKSQQEDLIQRMGKGETLEIGEFEVDCLGHSLIVMGVPMEKLVRYFELNAHNPTPWVPTCKISEIAQKLELNLSVTYYSELRMRRNSKVKTYRYDNTTDLLYPLGRVDGHYVPDIYSDWTFWAARNYVRIKERFGEKYNARAISLGYAMKQSGRSNAVKLRSYASTQVASEKKALATYGELLAVLVYGITEDRTPSGNKRSRTVHEAGAYTLFTQKPQIEEITPTEYITRTELYMYFKDALKSRILPQDMNEESVLEMGEKYCKENKGNSQTFLNLLEPVWSSDAHDFSWGKKTLVQKQGKPGVDMYSYEYFEDVYKENGEKAKDPWMFRDKMVREGRVIIDRETMAHKRLDIKTHYNIIAFDFETTTDGSHHKPYMCSIAYYACSGPNPFSYRFTDDLLTKDIATKSPEALGAEMVRKSFYGVNCGQQLIEYIIENFVRVKVLMIAHNMRYDLNQLMQSSKSVIEDGIFKTASKTNCAQLMLESSNGLKKRVNLLDTLQLMPMSLRSMAKTYDLPMEKEYMPYSLYNEKFFEENGYGENVEMDRVMVLEKAKVELGECEFELFYKQCVDVLGMNLTSENFKAMRYATHYCERDCEVLLIAYTRNREEVAKVEYITEDGSLMRSNLDVAHAVSVSQVATHLLGKSGCFEGTFLLSGTLRDYISTAVVGGRTMVEANIPHSAKGNLQNLDACSLYPSAMKVIANKYAGFPRGLPKFWTNEVDLTSPEITYYVITVKITKVKTPRTFPLLSVKTGNGGRHFTNMVEDVVLTIDKVTWEDAVEFQGVEGDIICGLYFNDGGNRRIGPLINHLYNKRKELKREGKMLHKQL